MHSHDSKCHWDVGSPLSIIPEMFNFQLWTIFKTQKKQGSCKSNLEVAEHLNFQNNISFIYWIIFHVAILRQGSMIWCNNCASLSLGSAGWPLNWHNMPYFCWCHLNYDGLLKLRFWSYKLVERLFPFGDFEPKQNRTTTVGNWISHRW